MLPGSNRLGEPPAGRQVLTPVGAGVPAGTAVLCGSTGSGVSVWVSGKLGCSAFGSGSAGASLGGAAGDAALVDVDGAELPVGAVDVPVAGGVVTGRVDVAGGDDVVGAVAGGVVDPDPVDGVDVLVGDAGMLVVTVFVEVTVLVSVAVSVTGSSVRVTGSAFEVMVEVAPSGTGCWVDNSVDWLLSSELDCVVARAV